MIKAFKYRIYPTVTQKELIGKHIGSCRFIFNLALECKNMAYSGMKFHVSYFKLNKELTQLKKEHIWLKEVNSQSLQQSLINLDFSFKQFYNGVSDFPKFKKKSSSNSFTIPQYVSINENELIIPKFNSGIKIKLHRPLVGEIKQATITKTATDKYFVSILCDNKNDFKDKKPISIENTIGIDLGLKTFLVGSDGSKFDNHKFLIKSQSKIKFLNRKYSKYKGKRVKKSLSLLHEKVSNQRKDFIQKVSSILINNHDTICIEDLNISGMIKNHKLAKSITDVSWGMFVDILKYKSNWNGNNIIQIGRFEPSSKTCSHCQFINKELKLSDRKWICPCCEKTIDRDLNAAINIKNIALKNILSVEDGLKNRNELLSKDGVLTSEVFIKNKSISLNQLLKLKRVKFNQS